MSESSHSRDYHYLSSIPLAPRSRNLTRLNPYSTQSHSPTDLSSPSTSNSHSAGGGGDVTPVFPSPYENPSSALFPFTPGPLELSPSPDDNTSPPPPLQPMSSPPRPRRPSKPDLAIIFSQPSPPPNGPLPEVPEQSSSSPTSPRSPPLSYRKPVPSFLPTPPRSDPLAFDFNNRRRSSTSSTFLPGQGTSRLSVGTFEGLLQQGETTTGEVAGYRDERSSSRLSALRSSGLDEPGVLNVVWSPRLNLGLNERGVEAREERLRQDQLKLQREMEGSDLGDRNHLVRVDDDRYLSPHTPSPRKGKRKGGDREIGPVGKRDIPFLSPRYHRGGGGEPEEDLEEIDQSGPVLRRGSKRLSDLEEPTSNSAHSANSPELEQIDHETRRPSQGRRKSRASTLQKLSKPKQLKEKGRKRIVSRPQGEGQEVEVVVHDSASQDEGSSTDNATSPVLTGNDEGDWERTRKEATCLAGRMNWSFVEFDSSLARFLHLLYPFAMFAHIPATVFLDFCLLYILCQVALFPAFPAANSTLAIFIRRRASIVPVPNIAESTGWWVAVGVYAACTAVWLFGVCLWRECGRGYLRRWGGGGGRVQIEKVYVDSASFNYACARSYGTFSFMWQVRLAPLRPKSPLAIAVEGTSRLDFVRETLCWYRQNWPTVLLLIPRAAISVAVLLLYTTTAYGASMSTGQFASRDSAFFNSTTGALTGFAAGVVLTNCVWAALRLVVLVVAWVGLWLFDRPFSCLRRSKRDEVYPPRYQLDRTVQTPSPFGFEEKSFQHGNNTLPRLSYGSLPPVDWRTRRQRRLRAAILVCLGSTPLSSTSSAFPSPFLKSPYVLGAGSPWTAASGKTRIGTVEQEKEFEERRRANLAKGGETLEDEPRSEVMNSPPRKQGFWSKVSPFVAPSATFQRSPIIQFSRVSPSPPVGQASALDSQHQQHHRGLSTQREGDISESRLHRRVRSLPLEQSDDYLHFEEVPLSVRDDRPSQASGTVEYPRRFSTLQSFPSPSPPMATSSSNQYPFPLASASIDTRLPSTDHLRLTIPDRPSLVSRFSAFSTKPSSTAASTPASGPPPVPPPPGSQLEAQLAQVPVEHLKLSDKLLSELRRVESDDRKASLKKIDKSTIRHLGATRDLPLEREKENKPIPVAVPVQDPTLRYSQNSFISQPDSVGGQSDISTLRGAVKTPDLSRSLATFPTTGECNEREAGGEKTNPTTSSPERPLLPPFRLSEDPRADNLSLGPATPVLGGNANEEGEFNRSPVL
ncbi:uncharacterized protein JCM6883_006044 [Sporobolomyces salmoneus]|uniref:uncharacterized protein n=1 Tax=Sporobolomyces salmoneus TaxID=183962 RepID=UPI00316B3E1B